MPHARQDKRPTVSTGTPPPLEGLSREADQGWGEGCVLAYPGPPPPPNLDPLRGSSPQGEGEYSSPHASYPDAYGGMPSIPSYRPRAFAGAGLAGITGWTQIML